MVQVKNPVGLSRDYIIHPGETLSEIIEDRGMSQKELAVRTGMTEKHISTVIHGQKNISSAFAKKLEYALDIEAVFWMNLQTNYERELLEFEEMNKITTEEINILKYFKEVIEKWAFFGWLDREANPPSMVLDFRKICRMSNLLDIPKIPNAAVYRTQNKNARVNPYVLFAWQRMCEILTENAETAAKVDIEKLRNKIADIKRVMFTRSSQIQHELSEIFSECGIAFKIVPNFTGAPVQGFIKKTVNEKLILCMTLRQKFADIFWFTLFHEIAHILNGDMRHEFTDFDAVSGEIEAKADSMAADFLINPGDYKKFIECKGYKNLNGIKDFAASQNVREYIVQGRLMREAIIDWKARPRYDWA